ncbi:MAG: RIP metalloprotease RseP [Rhizobiaceae bacterium]|nr:RIP metalloprotease RseP [Rhizobiaceae bacterium]
MELFLSLLGSTGALITGTLVPFFAVLLVVVFVHEMGHYLVGRWCGIGVKAFAIGFGPELLGYTSRNGVRWKLCAVPLGGYVKFVGDVGASSAPDHESLTELTAEERSVAFQLQANWKKALTVFAGPAANFLLAIVILTGFFMISGKTIAEPVVGELQPGSPAQMAGVQPGDRFVSVNGRAIETFADVQHVVNGRAGDSLQFVFDRNGAPVTLAITPELVERDDGLGNTVKLGIIGVVVDTSEERFKTVELGLGGALAAGVEETWRAVDRTLLFFKRLIGGREDRCQLGGPVRIAEMAGKAAEQGIFWLISLTAMLSIGIAILNLMPVPPLDGGHLVIYAVESATRRPVPERFKEFLYQAGFLAVLALIAFVFWNDLVAC